MQPLLDFRKTHFVTSSPDLAHLPPGQGIEIAFAGRSNAGKSTAINVICDHAGLAKTSRTPGRTRLINLFEVAPQCCLVDLPGYGYARVPESLRLAWQQAITDYLQRRTVLRALVVVMDIRHPFREADMQIIAWSAAANLQLLLLLTKADKLSRSACHNTLQRCAAQLDACGGGASVVLFSALKHQGVEECRHLLQGWYAQFLAPDRVAS